MRRRGALVPGADLVDEILTDLRAVMASEQESLLTLEEAAERSGYSRDHLGRLVREGKLPNAGRRGSPRIRVGDLPRKPPGRLAERTPKLYDPEADARTLLSRQGGSRNG